jgi:hypothetical protein
MQCIQFSSVMKVQTVACFNKRNLTAMPDPYQRRHRKIPGFVPVLFIQADAKDTENFLNIEIPQTKVVCEMHAIAKNSTFDCATTVSFFAGLFAPRCLQVRNDEPEAHKVVIGNAPGFRLAIDAEAMTINDPWPIPSTKKFRPNDPV